MTFFNGSHGGSTQLGTVFAFLLCLLGAAHAQIVDAIRPHELIVHRDGANSQRCTYLALRVTQLFRALPEEGFLARTELYTGEERIQFITRRHGDAWAQAELLCGDRETWTFPILTHNDSTKVLPAFNGDVRQIVMHPTETTADIPPLEIEPLIISGRSSNRVDLMFFADGYTSDEKPKFLEDALRLAEDISGNQTFYTVKPLLNFWAAFTPSKESGIGSGGKPKNTAFGLYRPGTELRGVYYDKPEVARAACFSLGDQCDFPILMGNDPLYGGLGGEFTVITPSLANGPLVLRHELGHSIIKVGEEYDGGFAYSGVNAAPNATFRAVPWVHWLTDPPHAHLHENEQKHSSHPNSSDSDHSAHASGVESAPRSLRVERTVMPLQDYAWTMLNTSAPWSTKFSSAGTYAWHLVRFSLSGVPRAEDLRVELDGKALAWAPRKDIGVDRWHYDIKIDKPLGGGMHNVTFVLKNKKTEGEAQLCNVEILEFGDENEFVTTPGHYSLYPTFSEKNETTYRPTNEDCLMRIVTTPDFCKACLEGLWSALLRRVTLIDDMSVGCSSEGERVLDLDLVPLAHLRTSSVDIDESYEITWTRNGLEVPEFKNSTTLIDDGGALGSYVVKVQYHTEEVRIDKDRLLESYAAAVVTTKCG